MVELLQTKLFIPRPRPNLVPRPRLTKRLNAGLAHKLTLIAAPAGFGKTTLMSEWIPTSPRCVTWLALDEADNDPVKFWTYFIASLQGLRPELGEGALALLQSPQAPPLTSTLTVLINEIAAFPDEFAIVLDDYHVIEFEPIHEGLTYLIAHLPANMHLVLTTRVDPPLPLARLRARDRLTELRANDLRFSAEEAAAFLRQVMGLKLTAEQVAALEGRTEGWIAGLQIAALSMQDRDDLSSFVQAFSGSHRHILGYLAEEVLDQRPKGTLNFLLRTSILDRLSGPLCEAVMGETGGQATLEDLEHANLFITPLDDEGLWYRYHPLFAEVLQARLRLSQPESLAVLHGRASEWYEAHDSIAEAIQHALAAGNAAQAADLIEREKWNLLGRGEGNTLRRWLDELSPEVVGSNPGLSLAYAWIYTLFRQTEAIEPRLLDAEKALDAHASMTAERPAQPDDAIRGEIATLRAEIALSQPDIPGAIALCRDALRLLPDDHLQMRGFATYFLGHGERASGHMAEAERAYAEASSLGLQADNLLIALHALVNLSIVQRVMGRLNEAKRTSQRILQITAERGRQTWPVANLAEYGLSKLYYEWNDLETAERYARQAVEAGQRGGLIGMEYDSQNVLALTLQAQNDPGEADRVLRHVAEMIAQHPNPVHAAYAAAWEARLRLRQGRMEPAARWAENCDLHSDDVMLPYAREIEYLTLVRVFIAQGQSSAALELLARLRQGAKTEQRTGSLIEISILQALAYQAQNGLIDAMNALQHALALAEPEGFVRSFVDEGEPMRRLLVAYQDQLRGQVEIGDGDEATRLLAYTGKLLAAFSSPAPVDQLKTVALLEPLSQRELDILRLIAEGYTNQEIAESLVIAVSTVKSHINHLYGKLGIQRRAQAVAAAHDLGLLAG